MTYVIGIDGGGTKTTCLFSRTDSLPTNSEIESHQIVGEGTNPYVIGFEEMRNRLETIIKQGLEKFGIHPNQVVSICCGLAGVGREEDRKQVYKELHTLQKNLQIDESATFTVCSDSVIALHGALPPKSSEGILIISGTGSNAIGMTKSGDFYKSGGWGHILGDEGSGYQLGLQALNAITRAHDRRGPETQLTEMILNSLQITKEKELVPFIYGKPRDKKEIARFAQFVIEAAELGDQVSIELLNDACDELVLHVESLFVQSNEFQHQTPITTTGSIFHYSELLRKRFIEKLKHKNLGIYYEAYQSPVYGAVLIGLRNYNKLLRKQGDAE